jgi:ribosomal protein S27AE
VLFSMKHVSNSGSRSNLTFFGDIIGNVPIAPLKCGYQLINHPDSKLETTILKLGPMLAPDIGDDGSLERVPGPKRLEARGESAWKEFTELNPSTGAFLKFAEKYGLLGSTRGLALRINGAVVACDPLVDWFHHYCKLRLLRVVFDNTSSDDLAGVVKIEQKKLMEEVETKFSNAAKGAFGQRPYWIQESIISGAQVGTMFQPAVWQFQSGLSSEELVNAAFDQLSFELSNHTRIKVRQRGRRNRLNMGDESNAKGLMQTATDIIITTTLEPNSLVGAMYAGILLKVCNYHIRRNLRPCLHCGGSILSPHKLRRYCGERCKQRAKREREAAKTMGANPSV